MSQIAPNISSELSKIQNAHKKLKVIQQISKSPQSHHKYHSSLAKVRDQKMGESGWKNDENINIKPDQFAETLLKENENEHTRKFKFELAQYHQCIPNPIKEKEFITVQISSNNLQEVEDGLSVQEMKPDDIREQKLYQKYSLKTHAPQLLRKRTIIENLQQQLREKDGVKPHDHGIMEKKVDNRS